MKQIYESNFYFILLMEIEEGSYYKVFLGINTKTNQEYEIKIFPNTKSNIERFILEKSILKRIIEIKKFAIRAVCFIGIKMITINNINYLKI